MKRKLLCAAAWLLAVALLCAGLAGCGPAAPAAGAGSGQSGVTGQDAASDGLDADSAEDTGDTGGTENASEDTGTALAGGDAPLAGITPPPVPDDGAERRVVEAATAEELLAILEGEDLSWLEIRLGDGVYDLGNSGIGLYGDPANGGIEGLSILGTGDTRIVVHGGGSAVDAASCYGLLLYGLTIDCCGAQGDGTGAGNALNLEFFSAEIVYCTLYGAAERGVTASYGSLVMRDCAIQDCGTGAAYWSEGSTAFAGCVFTGNGHAVPENLLLQVNHTDVETSGALTDCSFTANPCAHKAGTRLEQFNAETDRFEVASWEMDPGVTWQETAAVIETGNGWQ